MPRGVNTGYKCEEKYKGKHSEPLPHQKFASNYFLTHDTNLLAYMGLGSGKTFLSNFTAAEMLKSKKIKKIYVMAPGSLRSNWIDEFCKSVQDKELLKHYTFITYNYNVVNELPKNFNNSLVIIDEVHNLINAVKNQSKNASAIYAKLMMSPSARILALSGTPIYDKYWEWSLLGNLLKPGAFPNVIVNGHIQSENFTSLFDKAQDGSLIPKSESFEKALEGIVSFVPSLGENFYPKVIYEEPIKVVMTPQQQAVYIKEAATEAKILAIGPPEISYKYSDPEWYAFQSQMYVMAKKHILSRQPSNFVYPPEAYKITKIKGKEYKEKLEDDIAPKGWVQKKYFKADRLAKEYSSKVTALLRNIITNEKDHFSAKHMVFSFFKEKSGVNIIKAMLEMCGLKVATFTGDLSDKKRTELLRVFNSPANRYGQIIKVILCTESVKEGISLLETQHVHILESDPRENKIAQVIGRVARYKSHYNMPKKLQKVHVWRYWSVLPPELGGEETIDVVLYKQGQIKLQTINSFLDLLKKNSIENAAQKV